MHYKTVYSLLTVHRFSQQANNYLKITSVFFSRFVFVVFIRRRCLSQSVIKVRPVDDAQRRYNKDILKAYLEGRKTMNWVVGCLIGIDLETFDNLTRELSTHVMFPRYQEIPEIRKRLADNSSQQE